MQYGNNGGPTSPNWSFTFNGLNELESNNYVVPDEGYYSGTIVDNHPNEQYPERIEFTVQISGGQFDGAQVSKGIKLPSHANNLFVWKGLFQSLGYPDNEINQTSFNPNPADWNNVNVLFYWRPGNKELSIYRELRFYGKAEFERRKAKFDASKGATNTPSATPSVTPSATPSVPTTPSVSSSVPNAGQGLGGQGSGSSLLNRLRNN